MLYPGRGGLPCATRILNSRGKEQKNEERSDAFMEGRGRPGPRGIYPPRGIGRSRRNRWYDQVGRCAKHSIQQRVREHDVMLFLSSFWSVQRIITPTDPLTSTPGWLALEVYRSGRTTGYH